MIFLQHGYYTLIFEPCKGNRPKKVTNNYKIKDLFTVFSLIIKNDRPTSVRRSALVYKFEKAGYREGR